MKNWETWRETSLRSNSKFIYQGKLLLKSKWECKYAATHRWRISSIHQIKTCLNQLSACRRSRLAVLSILSSFPPVFSNERLSHHFLKPNLCFHQFLKTIFPHWHLSGTITRCLRSLLTASLMLTSAPGRLFFNKCHDPDLSLCCLIGKKKRPHRSFTAADEHLRCVRSAGKDANSAAWCHRGLTLVHYSH